MRDGVREGCDGAGGGSRERERAPGPRAHRRAGRPRDPGERRPSRRRSGWSAWSTRETCETGRARRTESAQTSWFPDGRVGERARRSSAGGGGQQRCESGRPGRDSTGGGGSTALTGRKGRRCRGGGQRSRRVVRRTRRRPRVWGRVRAWLNEWPARGTAAPRTPISWTSAPRSEWTGQRRSRWSMPVGTETAGPPRRPRRIANLVAPTGSRRRRTESPAPEGRGSPRWDRR